MASNNNWLPVEVLTHIFKQCDTQTLGRLSCACKTFRDIIRSDYLWKELSKNVLVSNCQDKEFLKKTRPILNCRDKCRVSSRWKNNVCERTVLFKSPKLMLLNLELEGDALYCSNGKRLERYSRTQCGSIVRKASQSIRAHRHDISEFVINGDEIISAGWDGSICRFSKKTFEEISSYEIYQPEAAKSISCIASKLDIIVCGSRDGNIRVFRTQEYQTTLRNEIYTANKILSVALMPFTKTLIAGMPALHNIHPLQLYDLEVCQSLFNLGEYAKGAGILCIQPESEHTVLTGGYDTYIRLWDLRTPQKCVSSWVEPFDNSIYCLKSDNNVTFASGANRDALMHLWDKRSTKLVNIQFARGYTGPVHSLVFDACRKIVALDSAVVEFNYNL